MVGRLFPPDGPRLSGKAGDAAEEKVWRALSEQLPEGWVAWHSLRLRTPGRAFGEGDFVIADPRRGLLVMEVKRGRVSLFGGRFYYEGGRPMEPPPLEQAHRYARKLREELTRVWPGEEVPFGVCCCLPETASEDRPSNSDLRDVLLDELDLLDLPAALSRAMDATICPGNAPPDRGWIDALTELWGSDWEPRVGLFGRARLGAARARRLNEQQVAALRGLARARRVVVSGGAGTGKSTVAMELAAEHAWSGAQVLVLCFTLPLSRKADEALAEAREAMGTTSRAVTIHALAREVARAAGLGVALDPSGAHEWDDLLAAVAALPQGHPAFAPHRAQILLLDEGQSFSDTDWAIVDHLVGDETTVWIFRDRAQAFWPERGVPARYTAGAVEYELQRQERMPPAIEELARACLAGRLADPSTLEAAAHADPDAPVRVVRRGERPLEEILAAELTRLQELGFSPGDLAVVTLAGQRSSRLFGRDRLGSHRVVPADDARADTHVVLDTFLRMQGLDRPVVLVCEGGSQAAARRAPARMHMALTRARAGVVWIVEPPPPAG